MEHPSRFDLNVALEQWRQELAAQPGITPDNRRELETHLSDILAGLRQRELTEEDIFLLACQRLGSPASPAKAAVKLEAALVWRTRVFWMAFGCLIIFLWEHLCAGVSNIVFAFTHLQSPAWKIALTIPFLPLLFILELVAIPWAIVRLAQGRIFKNPSSLDVVFSSRQRFLMGALFFTFIFQIGGAWAAYQVPRNHETPFLHFWLTGLTVYIWPLILITLTTWLLPKRDQCRQPAAPCRFDLNAAQKQWQLEMTGRPALEIQLNEVMAELRQRDLTDEEVFWLASHRLGPIENLAEEFAMAEPTNVWRERLLWMTLATLGIWLWSTLVACCVPGAVPHGFRPNWQDGITFLVPGILAVFLARGQLIKAPDFFAWIFASPRRFMISAIVLVLALNFCKMWELSHQPDRNMGRFWIILFIVTSLWSLTVAALIRWLLTGQRLARKSRNTPLST